MLDASNQWTSQSLSLCQIKWPHQSVLSAWCISMLSKAECLGLYLYAVVFLVCCNWILIRHQFLAIVSSHLWDLYSFCWLIPIFALSSSIYDLRSGWLAGNTDTCLILKLHVLCPCTIIITIFVQILPLPQSNKPVFVFSDERSRKALCLWGILPAVFLVRLFSSVGCVALIVCGRKPNTMRVDLCHFWSFANCSLLFWGSEIRFGRHRSIPGYLCGCNFARCIY